MPTSTTSLLHTTLPTTHLTLTSIIGSGSFATVYAATDLLTSHPYAVKALDKTGLTPDQLENQKKEVKLTQRVQGHPNIVRLERVVETSRWLFLVLEWCEMDLYDAITQTSGFPPSIVKQVFSQLCSALAHCHTLGISHRDIKPENALISSSYTVKLADFGLATCCPWSKEMGCGSVRYMAPECIDSPCTRSVGYDPFCTDVWSLGIILVNLLFGKNPWHEATASDPIYAAYRGSNPDILIEQFGITMEFNTVLARVFDPNPLSRPSVSELALLIDSLDRFIMDDPESCSTDSPVTSFWADSLFDPPYDAPPTPQLVSTSYTKLCDSGFDDGAGLLEQHARGRSDWIFTLPVFPPPEGPKRPDKDDEDEDEGFSFVKSAVEVLRVFVGE
ncbi:RAN protein kinase [Spizellomyces punctatus DAOM BR117]|uniref:RAN protein kinase n=1 Tax=Spizellomyces punctatus (strain DAOM BR117) TaxID=645134 RepID=A0A0L0HK60_SPIPD|nr:RAN protein kinase [Spizellomyces punctatus DAOM BR117]KND01275.1 RAN protein kinase [Spizellomyces punctatus DAOM BR117]|eukprot:XP_016609314.1 RAN protein kinase [Spizellomyces punctatus DAOM BR117]